MKRWMRSFTIRLRMSGAIAMVLGLFALVALTAGIGGHRMSELNTEFMHHSMKEQHNVADLRVALGQIRQFEKDMVIDYEQPEAVKKDQQAWESAQASLRQALNSLLEGEEDEDNPIARKAIESLDAYVAAAQPVVQQILASGFDNSQAVNRQLARAQDPIGEVKTDIEKIQQIITNESDVTVQAFQTEMTITAWLFGAVLVLVVVIVAPLTLLNSTSITGPIQHARDIALAIAEGDLTRPVHAEGKDEAADLLRALQQMQTALSGLVSDVRATAQNIQVASTEVASGNADLSQRTEQTASNLEQTASAMEELTSSVRDSAQSAGHASELASGAASVAERGGQAVAQVVATMDEINNASRKISDIIGVIDGIAFQTNILALNAAVEAARAGEQGRGFAVVAGEVRSLAQRSAEAAREIKRLISVSVEKVDNGAQQVQNAGSTMNEIVSSVQRVNGLIHEISAAANEQSKGIGQVNSAVSQLDQMTQQNAALVEESAAAAESLKDQATRLTNVVARFQIDGHGDRAVHAVAARPAATVQAPAARLSSATPSLALSAPTAALPPATPRIARVTRPSGPAPQPASRPAAPAATERRNEPSVTTAPDDDWETF
jgi:methyl-accepting chemotaxis protein